jgi:formiminotetrahydrofolate cyclodeaminase
MTQFARLPLEDFLSRLASEAPTPGGGTAAAAAGAMGAALAEMVAALTLSREKYAAVHDTMREIAALAASARAGFLDLADQDAEAYDQVVAARRMPRESAEEREARSRRIADANRRATEVPLATARLGVLLLARLPELLDKGNPNAASDAGSSAYFLEAAARSALANVAINLPGIAEARIAQELTGEARNLEAQVERLRAAVRAVLDRHAPSS